MRRLLWLGLTCGLLGCGAASPTTNDEAEATDDTAETASSGDGATAETSTDGETGGGAEPEPEGPFADVPFASTQIRDATPAGRTFVFQFREETIRVRYERWVFTEVSADGWTMTSTPVDEAGAVIEGEVETSRGTWAELEAHAHFPEAATEITNATLTLPLGRFRCRLYTVTDPDHSAVTRFWFATDLPGPPIRMVRAVNADTVVEMQIVSHEPGR